jgi:uncharacterized protein (DUF433 family)
LKCYRRTKLNQIAIIKSNSPHQRSHRVVEAESRITPSGKYVMTRQEIEHQLLTLSLMDKAEIVQSLTKALKMSGKGITKTPGVCGGEACIDGTRIAVWLLVEAQRIGISEAQLLQDYPHITAADLVNVWIYADAYPEEIAAAIRDNNEDF